MFLLIGTKKSFSTEELRRQLGHKRYQPIGEMVRKLRDVMSKRDNRYQLTAQVEPDEGFFSVELPGEENDKPLKRGHGSQKKAKVLVMMKVHPQRKTLQNGRTSQNAGYTRPEIQNDHRYCG